MERRYTLREAAEAMHAAGIWLVGQHGNDLADSEAVLVVEDSEQLIAERHGVNLDHYRAWRDHNWGCRAMADGGRRPCKLEVLAVEILARDDPRQFDPDAVESFYCKHHLARAFNETASRVTVPAEAVPI